MVSVNIDFIQNHEPRAQIYAVEEFYLPGEGFKLYLPDPDGRAIFNVPIEEAILAIHRVNGSSFTIKFVVKDTTKPALYHTFYTKSVIIDK